MSTISAKREEVRARAAARPASERLALNLCMLFALGSFFHFVRQDSLEGAVQSLEAMLLVLLPILVERVFHCKMASWAYIYITLYCLGPLIGHSYRLFYTTAWWDKLLHTSGGVVFALVGFCLPSLLDRKGSSSLALRLVFALCFSIAVSALWEFFEFGEDMLLGTDTQNDTYITGIHSYLLGSLPGQLGSLENITEVTVNGQTLPGYIDIGLIDTMGDMLVETLGALITFAVIALDRGRHPVFWRVQAEKLTA